MARRSARPMARQRVDPVTWLNLKIRLAVGPRCGHHSAGYNCEGNAVRLAELWHTWRAEILAEGSQPEWAVAVLDEGREGPRETDPRFPEDDPIQARVREHEAHLDAVARDHYLHVRDGQAAGRP
jgi:hypothetical protein